MLLAVESSCDESSVALIQDGRVVSVEIASQIALHTEYGGVVPELATRRHLLNLRPVALRAMERAGATPEDVIAVAATTGPGLPQALLAGIQFAQGFALSRELPFIPVNHHEAHLYSSWMFGDPLTLDYEAIPRCIALIVSGGHTALIDRTEDGRLLELGSTLDDAAGECFDKVGKMMGLEYPAGPTIDRLAREGGGSRFPFPRPMLDRPGFDFSFSGLKTSVRVFLERHPEVLEDGQGIRDLCASVQAAIVETLVGKSAKALRETGAQWLGVSGGVAMNSGLRQSMKAACEKLGVGLKVAPPSVCGDNAAMIGALAEAKWRLGLEPPSFDYHFTPRPNWDLTSGRSSEI